MTFGRMRILLATLLLPLAAQAITITSTSATGTTPQVFIGRAGCNANTGIPFVIDPQLGTAPDPTTITVGVTRSDGTCRSTSGGTLDRTFPPTFTGTTANVTILPTDFLNSSSGDAGVATCSSVGGSTASPAIYFVCAEFRTSTAFGGASVVAADLQVNFATTGPTPPTQPAVAPGDGHLRISWQPGSSAEGPFIQTYDVHVVPHGQAVDLTKRSVTVNAQTNADATATDDQKPLVNGSLYDVSVVATDSYGNVSDPSPLQSAQPVAIEDFYNTYRDNGGQALGGGGCGSTGGLTWIAGLSLTAALLARRRRKARAGLLGALLLGALALPAQAESKYDRPPRKLLFELKLDRYSPQVDSEAGLTGTPYRDVFGTRRPLRWQLEVDWEVAHPFGSLLLGGTVGYWQNIGKGLLPDGTPSQDTALLDVIPFGVVATYRFDYLADRFRWFPLIPYAQAGLSRALWASFNGRGDVSQRARPGSGGRGSGWTNGYTTALGVAFALDALDPDLSREAYTVMGIQRTSFFAEYGWTRLDNFRSGNALILSDRGWRFGLSLEF